MPNDNNLSKAIRIHEELKRKELEAIDQPQESSVDFAEISANCNKSIDANDAKSIVDSLKIASPY